MEPDDHSKREAGVGRHRITPRAVVLAFLLLPVNAYWLGQVEGVWHGLHMSCISLPANNLLLLVCLVALSRLLQRFGSRLALARAELLAIYSLLTIQTVFLGHDNLLALMGVMPGAAWYNTPARGWDALFFRYLPQWMVVTDDDAVTAFYMGGRPFYGSALAWYWLRPLFGWSALLMLLFLVHTSFSLILAERWTVRERLSYPIVRLPLELTRGGTPPFLSGPFWVGLVVAGTVDLVNGLWYLYPSFPHVPVREIDLRQHLTGPPFNAMGSTLVRFYLFVIGMGFLMPTDVLNSCWGFYLFGKAQRVIGQVAGWWQIPRFPFQGEQAAGGMLAIVLLALWTMRSYLREVLGVASGRCPPPGPRASAGQYRAALVTIPCAVLALGGLCRAMGMSFAIMLAFFALYFVISVGVTRLRAEVGPPSHSMLFVNPQDMLIVCLGTEGIGKRNLTLFALFWWFNRLNRNHPMPVALEALRMADAVQTDRGRVAVLMVSMAMASIAAAFLVYPPLFFQDGAVKAAAEVLGVGSDTFSRLNSWLRTARPASAIGAGAMVSGFAFTALLGAMRTRFLWWGLHPMGYVLGLSYAVDFYWVSLLIASVCKAALLRYGGGRAYHRAVPFFIGLIIGEFTVACAWSLLSLALHKPMYDAWW